MDEIKEYGTTTLKQDAADHQIELFTIIGEIEGHEILPATSKATKYEHILPKLAEVESRDLPLRK